MDNASINKSYLPTVMVTWCYVRGVLGSSSLVEADLKVNENELDESQSIYRLA